MRHWMILLLLLATGAHADERILDFHSAIIVYSDGSMLVTETLRVRAEGQQIRRGIYRDFPTDYRDQQGNRYRVAFDVIEVLRDGRREDYHTERHRNGVRVYIGHADRLLQRGDYTYTLSYRTNRQLGFFAGHDELYWNVTGNGWSFPIDHAEATVQLPPSLGDSTLTLEAYTGPAGSQGRLYRAAQIEQALAWFETTQPLGPQEGLTIVVGWPKGHVHAPTQQEQLGYLLDDNRELLVAGGGLLLLSFYYLMVWHRVGRDPEPGVIIPQYEPPPQFPPAALRFIRRMGYDPKTFAVALVGLAVKGLLRIDYRNGHYTAHREKTPTSELAPGEHALLKHLFDSSDSITFKQENHRRIKTAIDAHKAALKRHYEKLFFVTNSAWLLPGILISLATLALAAMQLPQGEEAFAGIFMLVWLSGWSVGVTVLVIGAVTAWRNAFHGGSFLGAIGLTAFSIPFLAGEGFGLWALLQFTSPSMVAILLGVLVLNFAFYHLLKAPTLAGRKLLDKVEGLRLYLEVAEKDELQLRHPPEKTPQLFERLLPYAMALDVEQRWAERFAAVFARLSAERQGYQPSWYRGSHFSSHDLGGFAGSLGGAMSSAIASSSSAPGSSSGGGGGGSSGGGGGGGGGGGW
ncbi:MAG: DUF2207 domain-containing protein [Thiohalomonadaceae bacterium]